MDKVRIQIIFPECVPIEERRLIAELVRLAVTRDVAPQYEIAQRVMARG